MTELLIEIGCEDLPARYVEPLAAALSEGLRDGLLRCGIDTGRVETFATPRRLAVRIAKVADTQPVQTLERRGPKLAAALRDGEPTPAGAGFARSCGVAFSELLHEDGQLVFRRNEPGKPTVALLPQLFDDTLQRMDELVPKRMRWGGGDETFVRPVQWLLALFGEDVVPLQRFGLTANRLTYGHRFHAPQAIALSRPADYDTALRSAYVWADPASRAAEIRRQVERLAAASGGVARITDALLGEVAALVEWPVAVAGSIDARFLELPPEVIVATVETNQRYFTLFSDARFRELRPTFITVANIESREVGQIVAGNERVVRPRLADALFFWEQDLREPLETLLPALDRVTFQAALGSLGARVTRLVALSGWLAQRLAADRTAAERAARLCKADLVSRMVFEFPELQGVIGGHYAARGGEAPEVVQAIAEHYFPTQQGAPIPSTALGCIVALADKLDLLAGCFAIGQKPTASKDPFGLRRAALGCLRICVEGALPMDLAAALGEALALQPAGQRGDAERDALWSFVVERQRGYALDRGASAEQFEAVRATGTSAPLDADRRLAALRTFAAGDAARSLAAADKRARNLLRQASEAVRPDALRAELLNEPAERQLVDALSRVEAAVAPLRERADYAGMLAQLATLRAPVDAFFDAVMVMADDTQLRTNRLALLARLDAACREVADLSQLPGA